MSNTMKITGSHGDMLNLECECGSDYMHEVKLPSDVDNALRQALAYEDKDTVYGRVIAFLGCEGCHRLSALRLDFHKGNSGLVMFPIDWRSFNG